MGAVVNLSMDLGINTISSKKRENIFLPSDISDLEIWLDASDDSSVILNGSNVSQWSDKSGNGEHFVQSTPAWQPAYTEQLNGENVITFDGADDVLGNSGFSGAQPATIYFALKEDADPGEGISTFFNSEYLDWVFNYDGRTGFNRYYLAANSSLIYPESPANLNFNLYTLVMNSSSSSITRNDTLLNSGNVGTGASGTDWYLGATEPSHFDFFDGKMAEFLFYGKILSGNEHIRVRNYFNSKWGM